MNERNETIRRMARDVLLRNRREDGNVRYTVPSADSYPYQWLWDSCFHAIALSHFDPEFGKEEIRTLLLRQFGNGMIPHIIYWKTGKLHWYDWGFVGTSTLTQPPMVAYAVWRLYEATGDKGFLHETYPLLMYYYRYLLERRDPFKRGLVGIINPDESGEDNSPRFDALFDFGSGVSSEEHHMRRFKLVEANRANGFDEVAMSETFWVEDVPFNAILVKNLDLLGAMAEVLGWKEDVEYCADRQKTISNTMRARMFENGVFWSLAPRRALRLNVATWAHFVPLFAKLYTHEEAERVIAAHLHNEQTFRAPFGIRTVSKQEAAYDDSGYSDEYARRFGGFWRGPVWFASQWFIYQGLLNYGFDEDAAWIRETTLALIEKSGFREHFSPETGKGGGARDFTWGALALDMLGTEDS